LLASSFQKKCDSSIKKIVLLLPHLYKIQIENMASNLNKFIAFGHNKIPTIAAQIICNHMLWVEIVDVIKHHMQHMAPSSLAKWTYA
jgi:hypothetical protein